MFLVSILSRSLRPALPAVLTAMLLTANACPSSAQTVIQGAHPIGLKHAQSQPYNFTGRIFDLGNPAIASGTLIRRHTVLTAGHVVFEPATGFLTNGTFTRGLYGTYSLSKSQIISAQAIAGYQAASTATGGAFDLSVVAFDLGLVLVAQAPIDDSWSNFLATPTLLADRSVPTFVLGYPGVTFDGRTMTYIVPTTPFVAVGTTAGSAIYENDEVSFEEGNSGGPIYVVPDGVHQYVLAEVSSGIPDASGEFNASFVRAIDKSAAKFLADAEYTASLIKSVTLTGPKKVSRGQTYTYTATVNFAVPSVNGAAATTDRYSELKLKSNAVNTATTKFVNIVKTSNTTFDVTYTNNLRPGATVNLQIFYDKTATPVGKSSRIIKVQ